MCIYIYIYIIHAYIHTYIPKYIIAGHGHGARLPRGVRGPAEPGLLICVYIYIYTERERDINMYIDIYII